METMKAKLPETETSNARNYSGDKELVSSYSLIGRMDGSLVELIDCRAWMGRSRNASTVYASIWVKNGEHWYSGKGQAGGYGYHKISAAIGEAITSAGITLYGSPYRREDGVDIDKRCSISGVGEGAIRSALRCIAQACGCEEFIIIEH